jgi:hypothetical protein
VGVGWLSGMKPLRVGIREVEPFGREGDPVCCLVGRRYAVGMVYRDYPARLVALKHGRLVTRRETAPHVMESLARGDFWLMG